MLGLSRSQNKECEEQTWTGPSPLTFCPCSFSPSVSLPLTSFHSHSFPFNVIHFLPFLFKGAKGSCLLPLHTPFPSHLHAPFVPHSNLSSKDGHLPEWFLILCYFGARSQSERTCDSQNVEFYSFSGLGFLRVKRERERRDLQIERKEPRKRWEWSYWERERESYRLGRESSFIILDWACVFHGTLRRFRKILPIFTPF